MIICDKKIICIPLDDETLTIQSNRSDGYASIVASTIMMQKEKIHEARVEALKKEKVKDENLHGMDKEFKNRLDGTLCIRRRMVVPMVRYGSMHHHLCQQVLDMSKDEGQLPEAIRFTSITKNTPLEMGKNSHGFYRKTTKDNKQLRHDLEVFRRRTTSYFVGRDPDDKLHFIEEPVEIMDREVKQLKQSRIPIMKFTITLDNSEHVYLALQPDNMIQSPRNSAECGLKLFVARIDLDRNLCCLVLRNIS
ncbi:hypothetical protein Tco_1553622 [Tanacetum coccineum]